MKVKIEIKNGKVRSYYGIFIKRERDLIDEAFNIKYSFKKPKDGTEYLEVRKLNNRKGV
jgi:hypothetical protein